MSLLSHAAGAMRIPGTGKIGGVSKHFLTDFYGQVRFNLPVQKFCNQIKNGFYYYGGKRYTIEGKLFCDYSTTNMCMPIMHASNMLMIMIRVRELRTLSNLNL